MYFGEIGVSFDGREDKSELDAADKVVPKDEGRAN